MAQRISMKGRHLNGKSAMKKAMTAMVMGVALLTLSSCGQGKSSEDAQTNEADSTAEADGGTAEVGGSAAEADGSADEVQETPDDNTANSAGFDLAELENLTGEYEYVSDLYEGEYSSYDVNEPSLEIKINDDGTCQIQIDLFRLWSFYDGVGKITAEGLEFAATGPGGKKVNGVIKREEDIATVTIFGQEWLDFAGLSEYKFYKTSDVPNIDEDFPDIDDFSADQRDGSAGADELLDSFINGRINAVDSADSTSTFSLADLNVDADKWETYSAGEKVDLDNDGENELIVNGLYGGIYLDARDGRVYEFAAGEGNALTLSYTVYNGTVWIMYSNRMNAGYECYHMEKYEGADNLVGEMNFSEEPVDADNPEFGMKYMLNGTEISYNEYTDLCSKIFAAEVNTAGGLEEY